MLISSQDKANFRNLAKEYHAVASLPVHEETKKAWRDLNGLRPGRPLIMIDQIPWTEMNLNNELDLLCENELLRQLEWNMRSELYKWRHFPCDMVFEPWLDVAKLYQDTGIGVESEISADDLGHVNAQTHIYRDQLANEKDLEKLKTPVILFEQEKTAARQAFIEDLIGDIIPVRMSGVHIWAAVWDRIVFWRGATPVLYDLIDRPDFIHRLMTRLMEIELAVLNQYEEQNLLDPFHKTIHCCGTHSDELPGPDYNPHKVRAANCWAAGAAQIFSEVSPAMHDEFELKYLKPYYDRFGLVNYGCCEPLHKKIAIIRQLDTVRSISISPWANVWEAAEQMGPDYLMARKPSPSYVAMDIFEEKFVKEETQKTLEACQASKTPVMFILKDITTVRNEPNRLTRWYETVRDVIAGF